MSNTTEKPLLDQPIPENAKKVFQGVIFDVYQWEQKGYDGKMRTFEKLRRPDTALIIPTTNDGKILIAKQEQPGKSPFIGLVGGRVDEGEEPLKAAKRELLEETGYEAKEWSLFHSVQPVSKIQWVIYFFIAKGCKKVAEQNLDGAEKVEPMLVDFDEFYEMVLHGDFRDESMKIKFLEAKSDPAKVDKLKKQFEM